MIQVANKMKDYVKMIEDPDFHPYRKLKKNKNSIKNKIISLKDKNRKVNFHSWSQEETESYRLFVQKNKQILALKDKSLKRMIFIRMASDIKTRNARQCRSHHQKIVQKYVQIQKYLDSFQTIHTKSNHQDNNSSHITENDFQTKNKEQCDEFSYNNTIQKLQLTTQKETFINQTFNLSTKQQQSQQEIFSVLNLDL